MIGRPNLYEFSEKLQTAFGCLLVQTKHLSVCVSWQISKLQIQIPQDCPLVQTEQEKTWQHLLLLWRDSHHQRARSHCLSLCRQRWPMYQRRLFKWWGFSSILYLSSSISGDHFVILGRNSLTSRDMKDESLYKIPFIGLFVQQLIKTSLFKLFLSDVQHPESKSKSKQVCKQKFSDVQHPEHAGGSGCKRSVKALRHDFAMLILKARYAIGPRTSCWRMLQLMLCLM